MSLEKLNLEKKKISIKLSKFLAKIDFTNIEKPISRGDSPLNTAAAYFPDLIEGLMDCGANVNGKGKHGFTPLMIACCHSNLKSFEILLKNKADPYFASETMNAFSCIVCHRQPKTDANACKIIDILLELGIDIEQRIGNESSTPLTVACGVSSVAIIHKLLDCGADPYAYVEGFKNVIGYAKQSSPKSYRILERWMLTHDIDITTNKKKALIL